MVEKTKGLMQNDKKEGAMTKLTKKQECIERPNEDEINAAWKEYSFEFNGVEIMNEDGYKRLIEALFKPIEQQNLPLY